MTDEEVTDDDLPVSNTEVRRQGFAVFDGLDRPGNAGAENAARLVEE
ncbi:MAG TPA: hypothetical protein VLG40_01305 [Candidatus Saccharimonas sp.]|nr:hypothetical protein [Candidatus Saccharimonas sp.]